MNDDIVFSFHSCDAAYECMNAIDRIADWEVARQYGTRSNYLYIVPKYFLKEPIEVRKKIAGLIALYGGKEW